MSAIQVENFSKEFRVGFQMRRLMAVKDLSFTVEEGEIFGFIGPNGAGKTTTLKALVGLLSPTRGRLLIFDRDVRQAASRQTLGFLPEEPYFYRYLKGREFLDFCGQFFGLPFPFRRRRIEEMLDLVGMKEAADLPLRKYSKGMLQRIGLAQALINDPNLVILDEPMSGLDPVGRSQIRRIILQLKEQGKTVLFSSHILSDVEMICDRVALIVRGELRQLGALSSFTPGQTRRIEIAADRVDVERMRQAGFPAVERDGALFIQVESEDSRDRAIAEVLAQKGRILSVVPQRESLEEVFAREIR
ncbi:MAG: ABC transporter ATP-binding protein [Candidatus Tectomicrobia bacterium]|uniref:ABC transporter ATP-binding protein n=1 Tax=Tectimicrobiota bacterium TaxID=2528274 RepID=A0A932M1L9_UNCTE|nr:ABC transporter ATP-binding protein [Candidatus Tectomicrobia bacterium]